MAVPNAVAKAVTGIQNAVTAAGILQGASDATLAPVVLAVIAAQSTIASEIAATDDLIGTGGNLAAGTSAADAVNYLNAQINAVGTQSQLLWLQGYVGRMAINIRQRL